MGGPGSALETPQPKPRNPALRDATAAFAAEALELMDDFLAAGGQAPHAEDDHWARRGDVFVRERRAGPVWAGLVRDLRESLQAMPSFQDAVEELRRDPLVAPQLDRMLGVGLHRRRVQARDVLESLVARLAAGQGDAALRLDPSAFAAAYDALERALHEPDIPFEALAPLRNVRAEGPLDLAFGLRIAPLRDDEVVQLIRAGQAELADGVVVDPPRFAVRAAYRVPKAASAAGPAAAQAEAEERIEDVLRALAAFQPGRVARAAVLHRSDHWFLRDAAFAGPPPRAPPWGGTYALGAAEARAFAAFWAVVESPAVRRRKSLGVALRRFHDAGLRRRPEDRLIDLLVVAEALALNVPHDSSDRAEMLHRLALRAGSGLALHRARREVDRHVRAAYRVRDDIVHGSPPRLPPAADGAQATLDGFIDGTEAMMRGALQRGIALAADPSGDHAAAPDWPALVAKAAGLGPPRA